MFLADLNHEQRRAFLSIARAMTEVDGLKEEEEQLLRFFEIESGVSLDDAPDGDPTTFTSLFEDRRSQVSLLLELIGLGYTDAEYTEAEAAFVRTFAEAFSIPTEELDVFENWVLRQLSLYEEAESLRSNDQ